MKRCALVMPIVALATLSACGDEGISSSQAVTTTTITVVQEVSEGAKPDTSAPSQITETVDQDVDVSPAERNLGPCDIASIRADLGASPVDTVSFCDGRWASVGKYATDLVVYPHWDGSKWQMLPYDGQTNGLGMSQPCYLPETLAPYNPPIAVKIPVCDPANYTAKSR